MDAAAEEEKRAADEEKEQRRLNAAEHKTTLRVQRRQLLSAFLGFSDWAQAHLQGKEKLSNLAETDRLNLGLEAFTVLVLIKREQQKDAEMDALQASMAALRLKQEQEAQEREQAKKLESLEYCAANSLTPRADERMRLVIDTNVYLEITHEPARMWDEFERQHSATAKVFIPQVVLEEIDKMRHHSHADKSAYARTMMRYLERKFKGTRANRASFWELQDREIDERYRRKVSGTAAGKRSCDMRIFYFVRDCHRQRPGCMTLVTNDQPLALEGASVGIEALSRQQLFAVKRIAPSPPTNQSTNTEARNEGERASEKESARRGPCEKTEGNGGKNRGRNGNDSGIGGDMAGLSLEDREARNEGRGQVKQAPPDRKKHAQKLRDEAFEALEHAEQEARGRKKQVGGGKGRVCARERKRVPCCSRSRARSGSKCRCCSSTCCRYMPCCSWSGSKCR